MPSLFLDFNVLDKKKLISFLR